MSSSRTFLGVLVITGSLLASAPALMGSSLENLNQNQGVIIQTATPSILNSTPYFLASRENRDYGEGNNMLQENNAGSSDTQPTMTPPSTMNDNSATDKVIVFDHPNHG